MARYISAQRKLQQGVVLPPSKPGAQSTMTTRGTPRLRTLRPGEGRPPFVPTTAQRQLVTVWRGTGIAPDDIARQIGISPHTLRKHFPDELDHGLTTLVSKMSAKVVTKALAGDGQMLKFYLTNFGGDAWKEKKQLEMTGKNGVPLDPPNLVVSFMALPAPAAAASDESA